MITSYSIVQGFRISWLTTSIAIVVVVVVYLLRFAFRSSIKYPPGPPQPWLVGHTFQVPRTKTWKYFHELKKQYGPVIKLSLAGDDILVLNDQKDAEALLAKRSYNYSSRKPLIYAGKYLSQNKRLVLLPYGDGFKMQRQAFHEMLQPKVVEAYHKMQLEESSKLLFDMLRCPSDAFLNVKRFTACLVFRLAYGRRLSADDSDLREVLDILDSFIDDCYPGRHLVDTFPFLDIQWLPDFVVPWRTEAKKKHEREIKYYLRLLNEVKHRMSKGEDALECFAARLWENQAKNNLDAEALAYIAGSAFEAGTGTTAGTVLFFIMAMIVNPEALRAAQSEVDKLLDVNNEMGPPTFDHMADLPYCNAVCKEVLRWLPAAPGGFPHLSDKDDEYKGYTIRAKTMVIPNIWSMHMDEEQFPNANQFRPERYLEQHEKGDKISLFDGHYAFGFGRRVCPGRYMGVNTVWIAMVQLIWGFNISYAKDTEGHSIPIDLDAVTSGINIEPEPFKFEITPRSEAHAKRIRELALWYNYGSD